jgi:hypothetical protein
MCFQPSWLVAFGNRAILRLVFLGVLYVPLFFCLITQGFGTVLEFVPFNDVCPIHGFGRLVGQITGGFHELFKSCLIFLVHLAPVDSVGMP